MNKLSAWARSLEIAREDWVLSTSFESMVTAETGDAIPDYAWRRMKGDHNTDFYGFEVRKEDVTRSGRQLGLIDSMSTTDAQLSATLTDTESAIGYYGAADTTGTRFWTCYHSVKMKNRGLVAYFTHLIGDRDPSFTSSWNTLKNSRDFRWSKQTVGIVAFRLLLKIQPFLHNEKTIAEANCIISHGPRVTGGQHPFVRCGAIPVRRGVWKWPNI